MAPKVVDREEKQRAIALASVAIFGEKGFDKTRMEDVAKAAGVGKGTIYEYFKTKEKLMDGAVAALFADMAGDMMPGFDESASITQILVDALNKTAESMKNLGFAYRFFLEYMIYVSRTDQPPSLLAEMLTGYRHWLADLLRRGIAAGEFRDDLDPFETAASLAAWFDGAVFHWYTLPSSVSLEAMGRCFIEAILNGLIPRNPPDK